MLHSRLENQFKNYKKYGGCNVDIKALNVIFQIAGVDGQYTVTIVSTPTGTPVSGSTNTFDYPILSSVTLTCMVTSNDGSPVTVTGYSWNTTGCFTVTATRYSWNTTGWFRNYYGYVSCFPDGKTTQNVSEDSVLARDAGTVRCTAIINSESFTSGPFTLRITGMHQLFAHIHINNNTY